ncbi:MAG: peptide chain release factor-like protein [Coriobacteriia bacterium]|nr:peptide chain release factor-like protein [Coriobacteriia bacterium]
MHEYRIPETDEALLAECDVQVFRASGPGGQSVNTTDSAVRLVHGPSGITVTYRRERSQLRNKRECLKTLRTRLENALRPVPVRKATKPSQAARMRRLTAKRHLSQKKRTRQRPPSDE